MPAGYRYHYTSTNSVSSLSLSSASDSSTSCFDSDSDSPSENSGWSRHVNTTGRSRMNGQMQQTRSTERRRTWSGRHLDDDRGTPSPLESVYDNDGESEGGLCLGGSDRLHAPVRTQHEGRDAGDRNQRSRPLVEYGSGPCSSPSHSRSTASNTTTPPPPAYQPASVTRPIPSNPKTFSQHFPSNHPLFIYHPPSLDGNLNLAIDVQTRQGPLTLFHLRMNNLRGREFSLRRYSRESGREVCRSTRRQKIHPGMENPLFLTAAKEARAEAKEEKRRRKSEQENKRANAVANVRNDEKIGGITRVLGNKNKSQDTTQREIPSPCPPGRNVVLHQEPRSPQTPTQLKPNEKPVRALRRVDSGYSSGSGGSLSPGIQAAAEARAGCLRDSGLEHLEEEPDVLEPDFEQQDLAEPEADYEDVEPVSHEYKLAENEVKLEFSNYAHLDLKRKGTKVAAKRYDFDYWGIKYTWKRIERTSRTKDPLEPTSQGEAQRRHTIGANHHVEQAKVPQTHVEFLLIRSGQSTSVATIVPVQLSSEESAIETELGGWVPRCTFQILDEDVLCAHNAADVSDVLLATGLMALADDCINGQWHTPKRRFTQLPKISPGLKLSLPGRWPKIDTKVFSPKRWSFSESRNVAHADSQESATASARSDAAIPSGNRSANFRRSSLVSSREAGDIRVAHLDGFAARIAKFSNQRQFQDKNIKSSNPLRRLSMGAGF